MKKNIHKYMKQHGLENIRVAENIERKVYWTEESPAHFFSDEMHDVAVHFSVQKCLKSLDAFSCY